MPVLTGLDVVGIQRFVFGSNRLRDVVGASWLVDWSTARTLGDGQWQGALAELAEAQVILAAGGNAVLKFDSLPAAKHFAAQYSRRVFDQAPGVQIAIAHRPYGPEELAKALRALQVDLARNKLERRPHAPLLGISVTANCANTGLPAIDFDPRNRSRPLSRQALQTGRKTLHEQSTARWRRLLPRERTDLERFEFPSELDDLGSSRAERSLLGVVHIDGNSIGSRIQDWLNRHVEEETSDQVVETEYRAWSRALANLGDSALRTVLSRILGGLHRRDTPEGGSELWLTGRRDYSSGDGSEPRDLSFPLREVTPAEKQDGAKHEWWLPVRPILLGGDDLTFLCDGRIALDLAATALQAMEQTAKTVPHLNADQTPITACAGVAIVPYHAPFVRSYELAESLCQSAKKEARKLKERGRHVSCLDWHVGLPKPGQSIRDVRQREYGVQRGDDTIRLTCRPYPLTADDVDESSLSWQWLDETLLDAPQCGLRASKAWNMRRNKVKELRDVLRSGPDADQAVQQSIQRWQVVAPTIRLPFPIHKDGFVHRHATPLLDALELLDLHLPLGPLTKAGERPVEETP